MKDVKQLITEDMKLRGLAPRTQDRYLHAIKALAEHYHRPLDKITEKQVRKYLLYLIGPKGYAKTTFNIDLCAIKFLYRRTLGREWNLLQIKCSKTGQRYGFSPPRKASSPLLPTACNAVSRQPSGKAIYTRT